MWRPAGSFVLVTNGDIDLCLGQPFDTAQVGAGQIGAIEACHPKIRSSKVRSAQRGLSQEGAAETCFAKVRPRPTGPCANPRRASSRAEHRRRSGSPRTRQLRSGRHSAGTHGPARLSAATRTRMSAPGRSAPSRSAYERLAPLSRASGEVRLQYRGAPAGRRRSDWPSKGPHAYRRLRAGRGRTGHAAVHAGEAHPERSTDEKLARAPSFRLVSK